MPDRRATALVGLRPAPKTERIVDEAAIEAARKRDARTCLYGLTTSERCGGAIHVHHIDTRGSGGDDVLENLICLCTQHHNLAHNGEIQKSSLRAILTRLYNYRFGENR